MRFKKISAIIMALVVVLALVLSVITATNVQDGIDPSLSTNKTFRENIGAFLEALNLSAGTGSEATDSTTAAGDTGSDNMNIVGSYFTAERVSAARDNIAKYEWATDLAETQIGYADMFKGSLDHMLQIVGAYTLPRSSRVGTKMDNNYTRCNYCGKTNSWSTGLESERRWKVRCTVCQRDFPSNDFGSFFELGYVNGVFNYETALNKHHELFGDHTVEKPAVKVNDLDARYKQWDEICDQWYAYYGYGNPDGYLYNESFDDVRESNVDPVTGIEVDGAVWGVDDGYGYFTNNTFTKNNNTYREIDAYFAYYNLRVLRWAMYRTQSFGEAYLYTGEEEYGLVGAILLDRFADVYPKAFVENFYYVCQYTNKAGKVVDFDNYYLSTGGGHQGKLNGKIEDGSMMKYLLLGADALRSFLKTDNKELTTYLSAKAKEYGLTNQKNSGADIWTNWADNLIYQTLAAAKTGDLLGNVGIMEAALALAALVLDEDIRSQEIMTFLYATAPRSGDKDFDQNNILGGNAGNVFVELLDRDGMGDEGAPAYNMGWVNDFAEMAEYVSLHTDNPAYNPYANPKFLQMLSTGYYVTLVENYHAQVGDSGGAGSNLFFDDLEKLSTTFQHLKDTPAAKTAAKYIYIRSGKNVADLHYDLFTKDPESLREDILALVDEDDLSIPSTMMAGFGFAALRGGEKTDTSNTLYDYWMNFGYNGFGHSHPDSLEIGVDAYGMNFAPDLGTPYAKNSSDLNRWQWIEATISHNTVVVDEKTQQDTGTRNSDPLHFDDAGVVKVVDVDSSNAYEQTDIYRRTVVTVDMGDGNSYAVDFFRILGGSDHLYSFHAQALAPEDVTTDGFTATLDQVVYDNAGNAIVGSYAGNKVAYGSDPSNSVDPDDFVYPQGYTWLKNVRRASNVGSGAAVNFKITDSQNVIDDTGLNLRVTMLNDFTLNEVALASGFVPDGSNTNKIENNILEYMLARRTGAEGEDLDSLFTTVLEPYNAERVLFSMEPVSVTPDGELNATDVAKAVKVVRTDGRVDYIVYATNNSVIYTVTDGSVSFSFRGVVGVYSVDADGNKVYSYVLDGDIIGDATEVYTYNAYTGTVASFTEDLNSQNYIYVNTEEDNVDVSALVGRWIYIENDGVENGAYEIKGAEQVDGQLKLDIGMTTLIRGYMDSSDASAGYVYNISVGQTFTIPLSYVSE